MRKIKNIKERSTILLFLRICQAALEQVILNNYSVLPEQLKKGAWKVITEDRKMWKKINKIIKEKYKK